MSGILVTGTSSDAGKSAVVTGLCRAFSRRGINVAPFKAQNMSNNSCVCPDGAEIGRAQYLQAQAAGVTPSALLNPVLLKPGSDRQSHIVLLGKPAGLLASGQYATGRLELAQAAFEAYRQLSDSYDLVVCEGAGSPAEINLRQGDYVNMGLAQRFNLPTIVVGDIDRGGVLASLYGTWALLEPTDRQLLAGYIINKFRGDQSVLDPGLVELSKRSGLTNFGVLPYLHGVWIDSEDAFKVARWDDVPATNELTIVVAKFPRISNSTDVEALASEPGVRVLVSEKPTDFVNADLVVLPGSRASVNDLNWLRDTGIAQVLIERHRIQRPILGICGGYEMLAQNIDDMVESESHVEGLGLLAANVVFEPTKTTRQASYYWGEQIVDGYEIHHGQVKPTSDFTPFLDGMRNQNCFGSMLHGAFENDGFRRAFLKEIAELTGRDWHPDMAGGGYGQLREAMIDSLADALERHVDLAAILEVAGVN